MPLILHYFCLFFSNKSSLWTKVNVLQCNKLLTILWFFPKRYYFYTINSSNSCNMDTKVLLHFKLHILCVSTGCFNSIYIFKTYVCHTSIMLKLWSTDISLCTAETVPFGSLRRRQRWSNSVESAVACSPLQKASTQSTQY